MLLVVAEEKRKWSGCHRDSSSNNNNTWNLGMLTVSTFNSNDEFSVFFVCVFLLLLLWWRWAEGHSHARTRTHAGTHAHTDHRDLPWDFGLPFGVLWAQKHKNHWATTFNLQFPFSMTPGFPTSTWMQQHKSCFKVVFSYAKKLFGVLWGCLQ